MACCFTEYIIGAYLTYYFVKDRAGTWSHTLVFKHNNYSKKIIIKKKWSLLRLHGVTFIDASSCWLLTLAYGFIQALICVSNSSPYRIRKLRKIIKLFYLQRTTTTFQVKENNLPVFFPVFNHFCETYTQHFLLTPPFCGFSSTDFYVFFFNITVYILKSCISVVSKQWQFFK